MFRIVLNRGKSRCGSGLDFFFLVTLLQLTLRLEGNAKLASLHPHFFRAPLKGHCRTRYARASGVKLPQLQSILLSPRFPQRVQFQFLAQS